MSRPSRPRSAADRHGLLATSTPPSRTTSDCSSAPLIIAALSVIRLHRYVTNCLDMRLCHLPGRAFARLGTQPEAAARTASLDRVWSTVCRRFLIAVPLGIVLTRPKYDASEPRFSPSPPPARPLPAYGLLISVPAWLGRGPWTVVWALTLFTILPVLRNTMVGLDQVDPSIIEAGRGMGLTKRQVLRQIELPLAVPVILAGVRTALIINVGMATLAFLIGGGGLGVTISSGLKLHGPGPDHRRGTLVAIIALTVDWIGAVAERCSAPKGLRTPAAHPEPPWRTRQGPRVHHRGLWSARVRGPSVIGSYSRPISSR